MTYGHTPTRYGVRKGVSPVRKRVATVRNYETPVRNYGLGVIKTIRALTGKGLVERKEMLEHLPHTLAEHISKEEARQWAQQLTACGAQVERKEL